MSPNAYLVLDKRRAKKDNRYPVKVRVGYNRISKDFRTGVDMTDEEYQAAILTKPSKDLRLKAGIIKAFQSKANDIIRNLQVFSWDVLENKYYGFSRDAGDIFPFFDLHINVVQAEGRLKTALSYTSARNSLRTFQNKIGFADLTPSFLKKYQQWMTSNQRSTTTTGIYLRSLRTIYNLAISEGVIDKNASYPFHRGKFSIPAGRNIKKALSMEEISKIMFYEPVGEQEAKARDFWIFSYLNSGVNFKDIANLKNKNIDGNMLRYVRAKTNVTSQGNQSIISVHLLKEAFVIIERYRNEDRSPDAFLFKIIDTTDSLQKRLRKVEQLIKNTNKYMRRICKVLEIDKEPTSYFARHSAATILKRSGASIEQIQESLGHASANTTRAYLDSFDDESKVTLSNFLTPKPLR